MELKEISCSLVFQVSIITVNSLPSIESVLVITGESLGFWLFILLGAVFVLPKIVHGVALAKPTSLEMRGTKQATALGSAFGFAAIASAVGLNPIVGAFAAGMALRGESAGSDRGARGVAVAFAIQD